MDGGARNPKASWKQSKLPCEAEFTLFSFFTFLLFGDVAYMRQRRGTKRQINFTLDDMSKGFL